MPADANVAFFLVGPTAIGKTAVAHTLAERGQHPILSTDAMLVYRGMDIGTAKPTAEEQQRYAYLGLDLVNPDKDFNVSAYLDAIQPELTKLPPHTTAIATGGTGLYVSSLLYGLESGPGADPALRKQLEDQFQSGGVEALQQTLQSMDAQALEQLADPQNPRRVMRTIERLAGGQPPLDTWKNKLPVRLAGLTMPREQLAQRIAERVERMYEEGLLEEVSKLQEQYPVWSNTAAQAIGYQEARAVLAGAMKESEARERTEARTRTLAKRQMTWFRNQFDMAWIEVETGAAIEELADAVQATWDRTGPCTLKTQQDQRDSNHE